MSYVADLTPGGGFGSFSGQPGVLPVGWLSASEPFSTGAVPPSVLDLLSQLAAALRGPHQCQAHPPGTTFFPAVTAGVHLCEMCVAAGDRPFSSTLEMLIDDGGRRFEAPLMIVHYIEAHGYQPPPAFIEAVARGGSVERLLSAQAAAAAEVLERHGMHP